MMIKQTIITKSHTEIWCPTEQQIDENTHLRISSNTWCAQAQQHNRQKGNPSNTGLITSTKCHKRPTQEAYDQHEEKR